MNKKVKTLLSNFKKLSRRRRAAQNRHLIFIAIGFLAVGLILGLIYFIWSLYTARDISYFLPEKSTIAYFEVRHLNLPNRLKSQEDLDIDFILKPFKQVKDFDYHQIVDDWSTGRMGVVWLQKDEKPTPLLFIQYQNKKKAETFFQEQDIPFRLIETYVFAGGDDDLLNRIQATYDGDLTSLYYSEGYQDSFNRLPNQKWLQGYANIKNIDFDTSTMTGKVIHSLQYIAKGIHFSIQQDPNGFKWNSFLNLDPELMSLQKNSWKLFNPTFRHQLSHYIGYEGLIAYIGGADLTEEWVNTLETLGNLNPVYGILLEGMLRAQFTDLFGAEITLRDDLYPLLEGEYALSLGKNEQGGWMIRLILENEDADFANIKLSKMMTGFQKLADRLTPRIHEVTLPDGTISRELIPDDSNLEKTESDYEGYTISCLEIQDSIYGFCYAVTNDIIILANHKKSIEESLNLYLNSGENLPHYQPFREPLSKLGKVSDEITFIDFKNLSLETDSIPYLKTLLPALESTAWVKHFEDEGVEMEGYLLIK